MYHAYLTKQVLMYCWSQSNTFHWNLNQWINICIKEIVLIMLSAKCRPYFCGLNELNSPGNNLYLPGKTRKKPWILSFPMGWVGLWCFLWWAPSAKGKDHHGVSSGWSSVWHCSNTGLSSSQYEQIPIILGVWTFCLTPFFFRSITFWRAYG